MIQNRKSEPVDATAVQQYQTMKPDRLLMGNDGQIRPHLHLAFHLTPQPAESFHTECYV